MTKINTLVKNASNSYFNTFKATAEMLADAFESSVHNRPNGNKNFRAKDKCLSFKGEKPCYLYIIDDSRTTYKLDENTNTIQIIVNCDD
jgi:hypothetical protein